MLLWKAKLLNSSLGTSCGPQNFIIRCGQRNLESSGFIVITYHARDITLLITAVFKHCRSCGAQTLLIFFLGGRFWTKADEFYWTHSQGAAQKFCPFSRNIQSLSPSFIYTLPLSCVGQEKKTKNDFLLHLPMQSLNRASLAYFAPAEYFPSWNEDSYTQIILHILNTVECFSHVSQDLG